MFKRRMLKDDSGGAAVPLEFLAVFSVILVAMVMVFSTINNMFVPYQTSTSDFSAVAMEVSEMLLKSTGNTVMGDSGWEDDPDSLVYMGLGCDTVYMVEYCSSGEVVVSYGGSKKITNPPDPPVYDDLEVDAGGPYYGDGPAHAGYLIDDVVIDLSGSASGGDPPYVSFDWVINNSVGDSIDPGEGEPCSGSGESLSVTFHMVGTYFAELTVTDSVGNVSSDTAMILITTQELTIIGFTEGYFMGYNGSDPMFIGSDPIFGNPLDVEEAEFTGPFFTFTIGHSSQGGDSSGFDSLIGDSSGFSFVQDISVDTHDGGSVYSVDVHTAKDGDGDSYVSSVEFHGSNAVYGRLDPDKISVLNDGLVDYDTVRDALGLDSFLDFNILITGFDGTVLLNFGESYSGRGAVSSYKRNIVVYPDIEAMMTVRVF